MQSKVSGTAGAFRWGPAAAALGATTLFQSAGYSAGNPPMTASAQSAPTATANYVDDKLLTARLEAVEARTETKFAQLLGKLDLLAEQIKPLSGEIKEAKDAAASTKTVIFGASLTLGGLIIGLFAFGWQIMDLAAGLFQAGGVK